MSVIEARSGLFWNEDTSVPIITAVILGTEGYNAALGRFSGHLSGNPASNAPEGPCAKPRIDCSRDRPSPQLEMSAIEARSGLFLNEDTSVPIITAVILGTEGYNPRLMKSFSLKTA